MQERQMINDCCYNMGIKISSANKPCDQPHWWYMWQATLTNINQQLINREHPLNSAEWPVGKIYLSWLFIAWVMSGSFRLFCWGAQVSSIERCLRWRSSSAVIWGPIRISHSSTSRIKAWKDSSSTGTRPWALMLLVAVSTWAGALWVVCMILRRWRSGWRERR